VGVASSAETILAGHFGLAMLASGPLPLTSTPSPLADRMAPQGLHCATRHCATRQQCPC
jgi:hypothetical protein